MLPPELSPLLEDLARNVHETWAKGRISQGWRYGKERNDALREHPSLVDYDSLSEAEKDFDRQTARATIRFILDHGFSITKKPS